MTRTTTVRPGLAERPRVVPSRPLSQTDVQAEVLSLAEATQEALDRPGGHGGGAAACTGRADG